MDDGSFENGSTLENSGLYSRRNLMPDEDVKRGDDLKGSNATEWYGTYRSQFDLLAGSANEAMRTLSRPSRATVDIQPSRWL